MVLLPVWLEHRVHIRGWKETRTLNVDIRSLVSLHEVGSNYMFKCKEVLFGVPSLPPLPH